MNSNHQDIVRCLRRIEGRVTGLRRLQENGRYCIDLFDQTSAVRPGPQATATLILEGHVSGCVRQAIEQGLGGEKAAEMLGAVGRFARSM